ncbi:MAG: TetR/AcrR family transcriptional regulator [Hyphomonadaceae bacterium]
MANRRQPLRARPQRRPDLRPDQILDAALDEFAARGFDAARMEDIAKKAGLSKAGVYLYFNGKEALLDALIAREVAPIAERVRVLAEAGAADPAGALRLIAATVAQRLFDPRVFQTPRLLISISNRFPALAERYRARVAQVAVGALESLTAAAVAQGVFRPVPPRAFVRAFIGPLFFEAMWTHVLRGESAFADAQALIDEHFDLLLRGVQAERAP